MSTLPNCYRCGCQPDLWSLSQDGRMRVARGLEPTGCSNHFNLAKGGLHMAVDKSTPQHAGTQTGTKGFGRREQHPDWLGDKVSEAGGRSRARLWYPSLEPCVDCGGQGADRHHSDGNTTNNEPDNVVSLCRRCHMIRDGRLDALPHFNRERALNANAARWKDRQDTTARPGDPCPQCGKRLNTGRRRHYTDYDMVTVKCLTTRNGCGYNAGAFKDRK